MDDLRVRILVSVTVYGDVVFAFFTPCDAALWFCVSGYANLPNPDLAAKVAGRLRIGHCAANHERRDVTLPSHVEFTCEIEPRLACMKHVMVAYYVRCTAR